MTGTSGSERNQHRGKQIVGKGCLREWENAIDRKKMVRASKKAKKKKETKGVDDL